MNTVKQKLASTIKELLSPGKGILAADESMGTIGKRFARENIESTPESRRSYRELLFTTKDIENYISGVILFDETIRQKTHDDIPIPELLQKKGIVPGIKVDKGTKPLPLYPGEKATEGLDGLRERLEEYRALGARFAKWRATLSITDTTPTDFCIETNVSTLARYAALCQELDIVPVVEPEVLMDGAHSIERCEEVTTTVLNYLFNHLFKARVSLEGLLLKPNMVISGKDAQSKAPIQQIAETTIRTLRRAVPAAVPGVAFLSGGQSPVEASQHLNEINKTKSMPWVITFSFSRALQEPTLSAWKGKKQNAPEAQKVFLRRAQLNSAASSGTYSENMEKHDS